MYDRKEGNMIKRNSLKNGRRGCKLVDMERVYKELDKGRSVKSVAQEWNVSVSTLYRRHNEYQAEIQEENQEEFPPMPDDIML